MNFARLAWATVAISLAALAVVLVVRTLSPPAPPLPDRLVGAPIPEVVLPMLSGDGAAVQAGPGMVDLKTAGVGRPMLLNLFASWCAPCRVEHPLLLEMQAQGVAVVGVSIRDAPAATRAFLDDLGDPYAMVLVDDGQAARALGADRGMPLSVAVDARGRVAAVHAGALTDRADAERLIEAMQAPPRPLPTAKTR